MPGSYWAFSPVSCICWENTPPWVCLGVQAVAPGAGDAGWTITAAASEVKRRSHDKCLSHSDCRQRKQKVQTLSATHPSLPSSALLPASLLNEGLHIQQTVRNRFLKWEEFTASRWKRPEWFSSFLWGGPGSAELLTRAAHSPARQGSTAAAYTARSSHKDYDSHKPAQ